LYALVVEAQNEVLRQRSRNRGAEAVWLAACVDGRRLTVFVWRRAASVDELPKEERRHCAARSPIPIRPLNRASTGVWRVEGKQGKQGKERFVDENPGQSIIINHNK